jgi:hypothetical protein
MGKGAASLCSLDASLFDNEHAASRGYGAHDGWPLDLKRFEVGVHVRPPRTHDQQNLVHGYVVVTAAVAVLRSARLQPRDHELLHIPLDCVSEHMLLAHSFFDAIRSRAGRRGQKEESGAAAH